MYPERPVQCPQSPEMGLFLVTVLQNESLGLTGAGQAQAEPKHC